MAALTGEIAAKFNSIGGDTSEMAAMSRTSRIEPDERNGNLIALSKDDISY